MVPDVPTPAAIVRLQGEGLGASKKGGSASRRGVDTSRKDNCVNAKGSWEPDLREELHSHGARF